MTTMLPNGLPKVENLSGRRLREKKLNSEEKMKKNRKKPEEFSKKKNE